MVHVQSGVTNRLISKARDEFVQNIIVALNYGTSLFEDVPSKCFRCTKRICMRQAMTQRFDSQALFISE